MAKIESTEIAELILVVAHINNQINMLRLQVEIISGSLAEFPASEKEIIHSLESSMRDTSLNIEELTNKLIEKLAGSINIKNG